MPLYRPSELKQLLERVGAAPRKALSQNFLLDGNIIKKIIQYADVSSDDLILEIGPGPGALTEALLAAGATVIAVEKDKIFAEALSDLESNTDRLMVYNEDIMTFDVEKAISSYNKPAKVIANLPYHLTTPILTRYMPLNHLFSSLVVMVQEEVARRFVADPGNKNYGSITLFLNFYSNPEYGFKVSRNCFYPRPRVESAVLKFTLHTPPKDVEEQKFFEITRTAFQQRRKILHNSLETLYDSTKVNEALIKIGKSINTRPEELSLEDFISLYHLL